MGSLVSHAPSLPNVKKLQDYEQLWRKYSVENFDGGKEDSEDAAKFIRDLDEKRANTWPGIPNVLDMTNVRNFDTFLYPYFKRWYSAPSYPNVIKTAYAAEEECGLNMELGNHVTESLNIMELITPQAVSYILKKHEKAANASLKSSPIADTRDPADQAAPPLTPEKIIARYNAGEWGDYVIFA